jgi:ABC-type sugar transport system ATPase subunit
VQAAVDATRGQLGDRVRLGLRPEHVVLGRAGEPNTLDAEVAFVESLGSSTQAYFEMPGLDDSFTCQLDGRVRPQRGDMLALQLPANACYLFDPVGRAYPRVGVPAQQQAA